MDINFSTTFDSYSKKNNIDYDGFGTSTKLGIGYTFKGGTSIFLANELRVYSGHFTRDGNLSKSLNVYFSNTKKTANWQISIGNDFPYLGNYGYNGSTGKFQAATDGGMTMNVIVGRWSKDFQKGLVVKAWGHTPHRISDGSGGYEMVEGENGDWGKGVYKVNNYQGGFYSAATITYYDNTLFSAKLQIGAGVQGRIPGGIGQGLLHEHLTGSPQFGGWSGLPVMKGYVEFGLSWDF